MFSNSQIVCMFLEMRQNCWAPRWFEVVNNIEYRRKNKCKELSIAISRLHLLDSHYSSSIITHCISAPKLLYTLRTPCCFDNDFLAQFDTIIVKTGLESVMDVSLSDHRWLQASLPVCDGGIGVRSVVSLAPSAFLASVVISRS